MERFTEKIRLKAKINPQTIVFPEADDKRVVQAVKIIEREKIADPILLSKDKIKPAQIEEFAADYFERKKHKGITLDQAREMMQDPIYYGAMMVRTGRAKGFVAGAQYTTAAVVRSAIQCLNIKKEYGLVSSCFVMAVPDCRFGAEGVFVYADCGVIPYPTSDQLASISIAAARFARDVLQVEPKVALLSFSTKGSAEGKSVIKVRQALEAIKARTDEFAVDGEIQSDAAIVPAVAQIKAPDSKVAGQANVLIFPSLDAGNICYKLTQRLAKAKAWGPIVLCTEEPCSDLSRGCSVDDIVDATAITVIRAQTGV